MKQTLWKTIRENNKKKGCIPFDERQMNTLRDLYIELAKTLIMTFMIFMLAYGYMEMYGKETSFSFLYLSMSLLGTITYYYTLRFCYSNVVCIDTTFEMVIVPAFIFTPYLLIVSCIILCNILHISLTFSIVFFCCYPIVIFLLYKAANRVYQKGRQQLECELNNGEIRFRSKRIVMTGALYASIILFILPIPYDIIFSIASFMATLLIVCNIYRYGFSTPHNEYILNDTGLYYHKALWGKKGNYIAYEDIQNIHVQDTFNIGYAKDKVRIECKDGSKIMLYPENAYQFYSELKQYI